MSMQISLNSIQIALIYKNTFEDSFSLLTKKTREIFGEEIKENNFGIPDELPPEIPRLEIIIDDSTRISFSKLRTDIFITGAIIEEALLAKIDSFLNIVEITGSTVKRAGFVKKEVYTNITEAFIRKNLRFSAEQRMENVYESDWRINEMKTDSAQVILNNITRIVLGKSDGTVALLVERDVNTRDDDRNPRFSETSEIRTHLLSLKEIAQEKHQVLD